MCEQTASQLATRSDTGSHNRLDLIQGLVPPHYVCNGYVSKLLQVTNESDDSITWYRSAITSRARSIQGCPIGKLLNRKSTNTSSSSFKYARDCYILEMFIRGDKSQNRRSFQKRRLN